MGKDEPQGQNPKSFGPQGPIPSCEETSICDRLHWHWIGSSLVWSVSRSNLCRMDVSLCRDHDQLKDQYQIGIAFYRLSLTLDDAALVRIMAIWWAHNSPKRRLVHHEIKRDKSTTWRASSSTIIVNREWLGKTPSGLSKEKGSPMTEWRPKGYEATNACISN